MNLRQVLGRFRKLPFGLVERVFPLPHSHLPAQVLNLTVDHLRWPDTETRIARTAQNQSWGLLGLFRMFTAQILWEELGLALSLLLANFSTCILPVTDKQETGESDTDRTQETEVHLILKVGLVPGKKDQSRFRILPLH